MVFDSNPSHLHIDYCVIGRLAGLNSDFMDGSYAEVPERSSDTSTRKAIITCECVVA